jgi:hypothetical protein
MRVTSEFFVAALIRRVFSAGGFAAVERKGATEAGAIFVRTRSRDGLETLYAPAPQSFFDEGKPNDRRFEVRRENADAFEIGDVMAREIKFDPDLWLVELEVDEIGDLLAVSEPL